MSENGEIYTAGKNFTLPPALTALTNSTSDKGSRKFIDKQILVIVPKLVRDCVSRHAKLGEMQR